MPDQAKIRWAIQDLNNAIRVARRAEEERRKKTVEVLNSLFPTTFDETDGLPLSREDRIILLNEGLCYLYWAEDDQIPVIDHGDQLQYQCAPRPGTQENFYVSEDNSVVVFYEPSPERGVEAVYNIFFVSDIVIDPKRDPVSR
jgi:hypothetical protein